MERVAVPLNRYISASSHSSILTPLCNDDCHCGSIQSHTAGSAVSTITATITMVSSSVKRIPTITHIAPVPIL